MSDKQSDPNNQTEGGTSKLVQRSLQVDMNIWRLALAKARTNNLSISSIVRQLLKAWVEGRVSITINGDDE
jgi:hypothetical protein